MIKIKDVHSVNHVLFAGEYSSIKDAVKAAVEQRVKLRYANLGGADLSGVNFVGVDVVGVNFAGANLQDANFTDAILTRAIFEYAYVNTPYFKNANLKDANFDGSYIAYFPDYKTDRTIVKLIGESPIFAIGPIGSRNDTLCSYRTEGGIFVRTGCFLQNIDKFVDDVKSEHAGTEFEKQYLEAVELIKTKLK